MNVDRIQLTKIRTSLFHALHGVINEQGAAYFFTFQEFSPAQIERTATLLEGNLKLAKGMFSKQELQTIRDLWFEHGPAICKRDFAQQKVPHALRKMTEAFLQHFSIQEW